MLAELAVINKDLPVPCRPSWT